MKEKYHIALDDYEKRTMVYCMNEVRNRLISEGKYTDAVDELLLKVIDTKARKCFRACRFVTISFDGQLLYCCPCFRLSQYRLNR